MLKAPKYLSTALFSDPEVVLRGLASEKVFSFG
jgi:hypothetical protein